MTANGRLLLPDIKFLEDLSKKVQNETERLAKLDLASMEAAVAAAQRAKEEIKLAIRHPHARTWLRQRNCGPNMFCLPR